MPTSCAPLSRLGIVLVLTAYLALLGWGDQPSHAAPAGAAQRGIAATQALSSTVAGNPLRLHRRLWVDRGFSAAKAATELAALGRLQDAALLRWLAARPTGVWFTGQSGDPDRLRRTMDAATAAHAVPVVVAYDIPYRDCGGYSANGAVSPAAYRTWVRSLARSIGRRPVVVIVEPDAVAHAVSGCLAESAVAERFGLLRYAVRTLKQNPNAAVYLDAGNAGWITPADRLVAPLHASGSDEADGFSLNVSSFYDTGSTVGYGTDLSRRLGGAHFVIDTSRNGNGAAPAQTDSSPSWCNPPGRAVGHDPTTHTGRALVDAYLWVKPPGNSDGACRTGEPPAGQWWTEYALQLVRGRGPAGSR